MSDDARDVAHHGSLGMYEAGFNFAILGMVLGAGFFVQWAVYLILIGYAGSRLINAGADTIDWMSVKLNSAKSKAAFWK